MTHFLKSVLKSPKAAPVLLEVGVLSWAASTAASAPPWSLYETPVDILTAIQRVQLASLYCGLAIQKQVFNFGMCHFQKLPAEKNFRDSASFYTQKRKREVDKAMSHDRPSTADNIDLHKLDFRPVITVLTVARSTMFPTRIYICIALVLQRLM